MYISIEEFEKMTPEEIWSKNKIEHLASSLVSEKLEDLRNTVVTLSAMMSIGKRKDALYLLCGYYSVVLKELKEKSIFIGYIRDWQNYEFLKFVLTDLAQYKDFYRQKDIINILSAALYRYPDVFTIEQKAELEMIIEDAKWGRKLKDKLLEKLDEEDLEKEKYNYLFGDID